jgi:hypothetical protein
MTQLTRNFDLAAVVVLVLLLGIAQTPRLRAAHLIHANRILNSAQERIIPCIQHRVMPRIRERMARVHRNDRVQRLVFSASE